MKNGTITIMARIMAMTILIATTSISNCILYYSHCDFYINYDYCYFNYGSYVNYENYSNYNYVTNIS